MRYLASISLSGEPVVAKKQNLLNENLLQIFYRASSACGQIMSVKCQCPPGFGNASPKGIITIILSGSPWRNVLMRHYTIDPSVVATRRLQGKSDGST